jgi:hypothetical protein
MAGACFPMQHDVTDHDARTNCIVTCLNGATAGILRLKFQGSKVASNVAGSMLVTTAPPQSPPQAGAKNVTVTTVKCPPSFDILLQQTSSQPSNEVCTCKELTFACNTSRHLATSNVNCTYKYLFPLLCIHLYSSYPWLVAS